jgi:hypothetical protein
LNCAPVRAANQNERRKRSFLANFLRIVRNFRYAPFVVYSFLTFSANHRYIIGHCHLPATDESRQVGDWPMGGVTLADADQSEGAGPLKWLRQADSFEKWRIIFYFLYLIYIYFLKILL